MDIRTISKNLLRLSREQGPGAAIRCIGRRALTRFREWRYGIQTEGVIYLGDLGLNDCERGEYGPSDYDDFKALMALVQIKSGQDVFLDFGAGLGRAVVLAATYPFRRVIGVELSEQLGEAARQNIGRARASFRCADTDIVTCDATLYEVPSDVTVIYFNNPFYGDVLERVLSNLQRSLVGPPGRISLVCNLPPESPFETQIRVKTWLALQCEVALPSGRRGLVFEAGVNSRRPKPSQEHSQ